jgi:hypothetical protein
MERSEASTSLMKWSDGLSNRVSIIISRYIDHMKFTAYMVAFSLSHFLPYSCGSISYNCINNCMFCMLLFNFVNYVFLCFLCCVFFLI